MKLHALSLVPLLIAGCFAAAPTQPEPSILESYRACSGTFPDGATWTCASAAPSVRVETSIPPGWQAVGDKVDNPYDELEFYRSPVVPGDPGGFGNEWGVWFKLTPRHEGDYASPLPTEYGGVVRVEDGPSFAWQSRAPTGFVRAPVPFPSNYLDRKNVDYVIYVPVVNGNVTEIERASVRPLWFDGAGCQACDRFRVVHEVKASNATYYLYEGEAIRHFGYGLGFKDGAQSAFIHIYLILSGNAFTW